MDIFCNASLPMLKQWSLYVLSSAVQNSSKFNLKFCIFYVDFFTNTLYYKTI